MPLEPFLGGALASALHVSLVPAAVQIYPISKIHLASTMGETFQYLALVKFRAHPVPNDFCTALFLAVDKITVIAHVCGNFLAITMLEIVVQESSVADVVIAVIGPFFPPARALRVKNLPETVHQSPLDLAFIKIAVGVRESILC
jgi:hypothetical protein